MPQDQNLITDPMDPRIPVVWKRAMAKDPTLAYNLMSGMGQQGPQANAAAPATASPASPASPGPSFGEPMDNGTLDPASQVQDAVSQFKDLQGKLFGGQIDLATFQDAVNKFMPTLKAGQTEATSGHDRASRINDAGLPELGNDISLGGADLKTFAGIFKNLMGRDPTGQDMKGFFDTVAPQLTSLPGGQDNTQLVHSAINQFMSDQYQPQIQGNQEQRMLDTLKKSQGQTQDLITQQNQQTINQLTSPEEVERFKEAYNAGGLVNSGAFSKGLADRLASAASGNMSTALGAVTLPQISGMGTTANVPYQQFLGGLGGGTAGFGQQQQSNTNFNMESDLARQMQEMMQPSALSQWAPIIEGGMVGAGSAARKPSYVCYELISRGLATPEEFDALHWKVLGAMFTRSKALYHYAVHGKKLVEAANRTNFDWAEAKTWFFDDVVNQPTAAAAVNQYALACKRLATLVAPELWDESVMRPSVADFFVYFIPIVLNAGYRRCYVELFRRTVKEFCHV